MILGERSWRIERLPEGRHFSKEYRGEREREGERDTCLVINMCIIKNMDKDLNWVNRSKPQSEGCF